MNRWAPASMDDRSDAPLRRAQSGAKTQPAHPRRATIAGLISCLHWPRVSPAHGSLHPMAKSPLLCSVWPSAQPLQGQLGFAADPPRACHVCRMLLGATATAPRRSMLRRNAGGALWLAAMRCSPGREPGALRRVRTQRSDASGRSVLWFAGRLRRPPAVEKTAAGVGPPRHSRSEVGALIALNPPTQAQHGGKLSSPQKILPPPAAKTRRHNARLLAPEDVVVMFFDIHPLDSRLPSPRHC